MKIDASHGLVFSPTDLCNFLGSPFVSWMDRYELGNPGKFKKDELSEDANLIIAMGNEHEQRMLEQFRGKGQSVATIDKAPAAPRDTLSAIRSRVPVIYQAKLESGNFAGYSDFIILDEESGGYQIWDTKLARSVKPYFVVQLCCYSELFAGMTGEPMPEKFGIILGTDAKGKNARPLLRVEDFFHFYRDLKQEFLDFHDSYDGNLERRPDPDPRGDHKHWKSLADAYLEECDHLIRVASISTGQIKKLNLAGVETLTELASAPPPESIPNIPQTTFDRLVHQARLQNETIALRRSDKTAMPRFDVLPHVDEEGQPVGLGALPPPDAADVYFDMEGYQLLPGGLEYLFGSTVIEPATGKYEFVEFWAHDREEEKKAFKNFVDWVHSRWKNSPRMHIYHYAAYEPATIRRLSTSHDSRQEKVDDLLRNNVFVDLYKVVKRGLRIGEPSYSLKKIENIYWRDRRVGKVTLAIGSMVHYARWLQSGEPRDWSKSKILSEIRDYNKDDCDSTADLAKWLRGLAAERGIPPLAADDGPVTELADEVPDEIEKLKAKLRANKEDKVAQVLADLVGFHRREDKPLWWKFFDRAETDPEDLRDDNSCIANVTAEGDKTKDKQSSIQQYTFDTTQDCKLKEAGGEFYFTHELETSLALTSLDYENGTLLLRATQRKLDKFGGDFPRTGSLIPNEILSSKPIATALTEVAASHLDHSLNPAAKALLERKSAPGLEAEASEAPLERAIRVVDEMDGDHLLIQGPPGTGKTYTAARMIASLLAKGKRIGITSNSHRAIENLMCECGNAMREQGRELVGVKAGSDDDIELFRRNPGVIPVDGGKAAASAYEDGVLGGTAWLFARPDMIDRLDYLFVDEAGQVSLANVVAMSRSSRNLVLLGDQMQLEQPIQGGHPGDARMSALQYALKDVKASPENEPAVFHAVVPENIGIFLGESRRMHSAVCEFISESVYEGRLTSHPDCDRQRIAVSRNAEHIRVESGVVFSGVEHEGNVQDSPEEVERVKAIFDELLGRPFTDRRGETRPLTVADFLFISPYNAQVRLLRHALPEGARVGSVDLFQGQEAPVCILSLCSSVGEYGSRGLGFILDKNRLNVAISRAQCLAVVVADPRIASTDASSVKEMMLLNLFCKIRWWPDGR